MAQSESDIFTYFPFCPFCLNKSLSYRLWSFNVYGLSDHLTCKTCGAKWHVGLMKIWNANKLQWAELVVDNLNKTGKNLLGQRQSPEFWQHLGIENHEQTKEYLTKHLRCSYCGTQNSPQNLEKHKKCVDCGAPFDEDGNLVSVWKIIAKL